MAVNDRRYGLPISCCYRLQNNSSKTNNTLLSLFRENVTLCVTKGLLKQIVYINFLLWTNIFIKSSRRGVHWTPMQTPGLHTDNPPVCVSRLRGCLASWLHQISVTNNSPKNPQPCRPLVKGGGFSRRKTGGIDLGMITWFATEPAAKYRI